MFPPFQTWLAQLILWRYFIAGSLVAGLAGWAWVSRRRPHERLSTASRFALALLLAATPVSWWLIRQNPPGLSNGPERFTASAYKSMGICRVPAEVKGEHVALFEEEDGTPFLFVHAPSSLTFDLRDQDRRLQVDYGFLQSAYADGGHTNGAVIRIEIRSREGRVDKLFEYYARPVERAADRLLLHAVVAVPRHQPGARLLISFLPGDNNDISWDHTFISYLSLE